MKTSVKGIALLLVLTLVLAVFGMTAVAYAPSTESVKESLDRSHLCSLTVTFAQGDVVFPNKSVDLFQVATVDDHLQYKPTAAFSDCGLNFTENPTDGNFGSMVAKVNSHILKEQLTPMATGQTNKDGEVAFTGLQSGIYLVSSVRCIVGEEFYTFESFMIADAAVDTDGTWVYDVKAFPKACNKTATNGIALYDLTIAWQDDGSVGRPDKVTVDIYSGSDIYKTVTLSPENNWHFSWQEVDVGQDWEVVQGQLGNHYYNLSITRRGDSFIVVNTVEDEPSEPEESDVSEPEASEPSEPEMSEPSEPEESKPSESSETEASKPEKEKPSTPKKEDASSPKTGDTTDYTVSCALMTLGGAVLILIGCVGLKRNKDKETA